MPSSHFASTCFTATGTYHSHDTVHKHLYHLQSGTKLKVTPDKQGAKIIGLSGQWHTCSALKGKRLSCCWGPQTRPTKHAAYTGSDFSSEEDQHAQWYMASGTIKKKKFFSQMGYKGVNKWMLPVAPTSFINPIARCVRDLPKHEVT